MNMKCRFWKHEWGKWSEPIEGKARNGFGEMIRCFIQDRECDVCGKIQLRKV